MCLGRSEGVQARKLNCKQKNSAVSKEASPPPKKFSTLNMPSGQTMGRGGGYVHLQHK